MMPGALSNRTSPTIVEAAEDPASVMSRTGSEHEDRSEPVDLMEDSASLQPLNRYSDN